jgi:hypothetical protein
MKKVLKIILIILIVFLVIIQFVRPSENTGNEIAANQITANYTIPVNIRETLKTSCYDCHSNTTVYPFYWKIQPVAWFLNNHIEEGKRHLNFSIFATYPLWKQYKSFKEIGEQVKEGDMPLSSYTIIHRNAVLSPEQKLSIENWAATSMKEMEAKYPADSLSRPRK